MKFFPRLNIEINPELVYQLLGYRRRSIEIPQKIIELVERELAIGRGLLRFKGIYDKFGIISNDGMVVLDNGYSIASSKFSKWVEGCNGLYLFVVTAGALFSERTAELIKSNQVSLAMVADAVGSAAAETCAEESEKFIRSLEADHHFTKRYSPGYGDWEVEDNVNLLKCLQAEKAGITINRGGLMIPEKSISAAMGII